MTAFSESPEFDQAITQAETALCDAYGCTPAARIDPDHIHRSDARAALLAVLQPEPCPELNCRGGHVSTVFVAPDGENGIQVENCLTCGGSGVSNSPPALWLAMSEQHGWPDDGQHWRECWHYVPPSTRSTT